MSANEPAPVVREQVPVVQHNGQVYVRADWMTARMRMWAQGYETTPEEFLIREGVPVPAAVMLPMVGRHLKAEADSIDLAVIESLSG